MQEQELIIIITSILHRLLPKHLLQQITFSDQLDLIKDEFITDYIILLTISDAKKYESFQFSKSNYSYNVFNILPKQLISKIRITIMLKKNHLNLKVLSCSDMAEIIAEIIESSEFQQELISYKMKIEQIVEIITSPCLLARDKTSEICSYFDVNVHYTDFECA